MTDKHYEREELVVSKSCSVLALGNRRDAPFWKQECNTLGYTTGSDVRTLEPTIAQMKDFFGRSDNWLFLGSHFLPGSGGNEPKMVNKHPSPATVDIVFFENAVSIRNGDNIETLDKGSGFKQHQNVKVVFWGGCNVALHATTVKIMRVLFGPHLLLGWKSQTGAPVTHSMFGGFGNSPPHSNPDFFGSISGHDTDLARVRKDWLETCDRTDWGGANIHELISAIDPDGQKGNLLRENYDDAISAIDPDGQEWIIESNVIKKGRPPSAFE